MGRGWSTYSFCKCGEAYHAAFGSKFHIHHEVCTSCGTPKNEWGPIVTARWESHSSLFSPVTWGTGRWVKRKN